MLVLEELLTHLLQLLRIETDGADGLVNPAFVSSEFGLVALAQLLSSILAQSHCRFMHHHHHVQLLDEFFGSGTIVLDHVVVLVESGDEMPRPQFLAFEPLVRLNEPEGDQIGLRQNLDHLLLTLLNTLCDLHLAGAGESADASHLPEVHAHQILSGRVETGGEVESGLPEKLIIKFEVIAVLDKVDLTTSVHHVDSHFGEDVEDLLHLLRVRGQVGKLLVDVIETKVALLAPFSHQLPHEAGLAAVQFSGSSRCRQGWGYNAEVVHVACLGVHGACDVSAWGSNCCN